FSLLVIMGALVVLNALLPNRYDYQAFTQFYFSSQSALAQRMQRAALAFDAVLSHCHDDQYLIGSNHFEPLNSLTARTRHSPYQLFYGMKRAVGGLGRKFSVQEPNPYFASKLKDDLQRTSIIVMSSESNFSEVPPIITQAIASDVALEAIAAHFR